MDLLAGCYIVAKSAHIDYVAPARGVVTATGVGDPQAFAAARTAVQAGQPVELTAGVEIADSQGRVAVKVALVMAIRPRRA
jgi:hypothetical protein